MVSGPSVIIGYYRYTDIWFEWCHSLPNPEDKGPVKAALAHDSLTHSDHPLHIRGVQGVQLYLGTFNTGESRLLFSSAQVDYIRYWLHAMGLTKQLVPLPYADCMLVEGDLKFVTKVNYPDGQSLRIAVKQIDKNNKRLKGSNPSLAARRHIFEQVRNLWDKKTGSWCAIDFEGWEYDHKVITEFGWSLVEWANGVSTHTFGHYIVKEHQKYRNHKYVPDHRYDYNFKPSMIVTKAEFKQCICDLIARLRSQGPTYLVFHDHTQDIKYLRSDSIDAPLDDMSYVLPDIAPDTGVFVVDTSDLFAALEGESGNKRSLPSVCKHLNIPTTYLHNAGNDAYYTLEALKIMASRGPVDIQREERWPNRVVEGVKVKFDPWEENSDYSDGDEVANTAKLNYIYPEGTVVQESAEVVDDNISE